MVTKRPRVALLVHTASDWTRLLLKGVSSYVQSCEGWNVLLEPRGFHESLSLPSKTQFDGLILRLTHVGLKQAVLQRRIPAVNVSWLGTHSAEIPKVVSDERACAEIGILHLREKGYGNIAFLGADPRLDYSNAIEEQCKRMSDDRYHGFRYPSSATLPLEHVCKWVKSLPKPVGVLAWNTSVSKRILEACRELEVHVPHEVGIVCIEHDHLIASLCETPLTNIDQDPVRVGFEAAKLLDLLMKGSPAPNEPVLIQPQGVICRQSTEMASTLDEIVQSALKFIQENFRKPIRVGDICTNLDISRRQLEYRFRSAINSTPANEIRRARIDNVKRLLAETSLSLDKIATMSGYDYSEVMIRAFKQNFGYTPGEYRKYQTNQT